MRPSFTAAMALSASGLVFTNHCVETSGSTMVPQRSHLLMASAYGSTFVEQAELFEIGDDALARLEAVQPRVRAGFGGHARVFADHLDLWQIVALAGFQIVGIVGGSHLHHAGAELRIGHFVEDDRDLAIHQRQRSRFVPARS